MFLLSLSDMLDTSGCTRPVEGHHCCQHRPGTTPKTDYNPRSTKTYPVTPPPFTGLRSLTFFAFFNRIIHPSKITVLSGNAEGPRVAGVGTLVVQSDSSSLPPSSTNWVGGPPSCLSSSPVWLLCCDCPPVPGSSRYLRVFLPRTRALWSG